MMPICRHIPRGHLCTTATALSSWDRMILKAYSIFYLPMPGLALALNLSFLD